MSPNYKDLHKVADQLEHKFSDVVDDASHPLARSLQSEIEEVVEDIEMNKSPRAVEDRIKSVQKLLDKARSLQGAVISDGDYSMLFRSYEQLREQVRRQPNY